MTSLNRIPRQTRRSGGDRLVDTWAHAVRQTGIGKAGIGSRAELQRFLRDLTDRLVRILVAKPFRPERARVVGADMVAADLTQPRVLARTISVLDTLLPAELAPYGSEISKLERRDRVARVLGELAAGYAEALADRTREKLTRPHDDRLPTQRDPARASRDNDAWFQAVFATAATGVAVFDLRGRLVQANEACAGMLGYSQRELLRKTVVDFAHPCDPSELRARYLELIKGERDQFRAEKRLVRRDGGELWCDMSVSLIRADDDTPQYVVAMIHDITERQRLQEQLRHQALHDPLTQLPNRMLFFDRLYAVFDSEEPDDRVGLCYLDLDGFKAFNDSLGHDVGDELLLRLANRLHERLAPAGHLVARMGGDEFVILVKRPPSTKALTELAESVRTVIREPVSIGGHQLRVTASIGVVEARVADTDPASLMKSADITLYWAKQGGKDRWALFDPERTDRDVARHTLAATLPAALARDEFVIEYQPIVNLATNRAVGAEALVRWEHPKYGRLNPEQFVVLAEETGIIHQLGRWILERACRQAVAWGDAHPESAPLISVNVSARQFTDERLAEDVLHLLGATGLPAERLQLELTESDSASFRDPQLKDQLVTLAKAGVRLVVDDFGTGHSNLDLIQDLPVQGLKIAGHFTHGLTSDKTTPEVDIVHTAIRLADRLGLEVTAQRVETAEQVAQLRQMGCPTGQGFYFGRPGPPGQVHRLLGGQSPTPPDSLHG